MKRTKFSNINLRGVLLFLLMLCGGTAVHADDGVVLLLTSGREVGFAFSSRPQVVPGEELVIRCADGVEVCYAYDEVQRISWGEVGATTSVDSPIVDGALVRVQFRVSPGELLPMACRQPRVCISIVPTGSWSARTVRSLKVLPFAFRSVIVDFTLCAPVRV